MPDNCCSTVNVYDDDIMNRSKPIKIPQNAPAMNLIFLILLGILFIINAIVKILDLVIERRCKTMENNELMDYQLNCI